MKNNKIDVEALTEMSRTYITDDPETLRLSTEIANECADATGKKKSAKYFNLVFRRRTFIYCYIY